MGMHFEKRCLSLWVPGGQEYVSPTFVSSNLEQSRMQIPYTLGRYYRECWKGRVSIDILGCWKEPILILITVKEFYSSFYKCKVLTLISRVYISRELVVGGGNGGDERIFMYSKILIMLYQWSRSTHFFVCEYASVSSSLPQLTLEIRLSL